MVNSINNDNNSIQSSPQNSNQQTIKPGDTMSAIAKENNVSLNDLIKANPQIQNPNLIQVGQEINIPSAKSQTGSLAGISVAKAMAQDNIAMPTATPKGQTGSLDGIKVAKGNEMAERPANTKVSQQDSISASLPQPYGQYQKEILAASQKYNISPEIITGVISRETNGRNIIGDGGHGHGLMQIDDRFHGPFLRNNQNGLNPASNIDYGTSLLRQNLNHFKGDYQKALAAYNAGIGGVERALRNGRSADSATTGNNYGADVLRRAEGFKQYFSGKTNNSTPPANSPMVNATVSETLETPKRQNATSSRPQAQEIDGFRQTNGNGSYTVKPGDTLSEIAQRHGVSLSSVISANPQIQNPNLIFPNQQINIPGGARTTSSAPSNNLAGSHIVRSGETLSGIAQRYGVSLSNVISANPQIQNPNLIFAGQSVRIPSGGTSGESVPASRPETRPQGSQNTPSAPSVPAPNLPPGRYDGRTPAPGTTRTDAWNPINPPLTNQAGNRSASNYDQVLNQLAVANNPRYAQRNGNTYCNIYVWDATKAMGAEIPHWVNGRELDANATVDWMRGTGANQGWRKISAEEAQSRANQGMPTVALWKNPGGIGHVAMVRPGEIANGPAIAQAGARNFNNGHTGDSFGSRPVEYWTHN